MTDEEVQLIKRTAETQCLPGFIDGLIEQLEIGGKNESDLQQVNPV